MNDKAWTDSVIKNKFGILKNQFEMSNTSIEKAVEIYKRSITKNILKGRPIDAMIAAIIYAACKNSETPYTLNDITKATGLRKNSIAKCYRVILINLNLQMPVSNIKQCVSRITKNIKISNNTKQKAITILNNAKKRNHLAGKDIMGVTAAAIYIASRDMGEKISQRKLANASMLTEVTIRNRCKGLQSIN